MDYIYLVERILCTFATRFSSVWYISQQWRQRCTLYSLRKITCALEPGLFAYFPVAILFAQQCNWQFASPFFSSEGIVGMWLRVKSNRFLRQPTLGQSAFVFSGAHCWFVFCREEGYWEDFLCGQYLFGLRYAKPTCSLKSWCEYVGCINLYSQYQCIIMHALAKETSKPQMNNAHHHFSLHWNLIMP